MTRRYTFCPYLILPQYCLKNFKFTVDFAEREKYNPFPTYSYQTPQSFFFNINLPQKVDTSVILSTCLYTK